LPPADTTIAMPALRRAQRASLPEPEPMVTPEPPPSESQADVSEKPPASHVR